MILKFFFITISNNKFYNLCCQMNKNNGQLQNSCYNRLSSTTTIYYSHKIQMTIFDLFLITTNKPVHVNSNNRKQTSFCMLLFWTSNSTHEHKSTSNVNSSWRCINKSPLFVFKLWLVPHYDLSNNCTIFHKLLFHLSIHADKILVCFFNIAKNTVLYLKQE